VNELSAKIIEMIDTALTGIIFTQKYSVIRAIIRQCNYMEFFRMFYNVGIHFAIIVDSFVPTEDEMRVLIASHFAHINLIYRPLAKKYVKDNPSVKIKVDGALQRIRLRGVIKKFFFLEVHNDINGLYLLSQHPYINWEHITTANVEWNPRGVSRNPNITWDIVKSNPKYPWSYYDLSFNPNMSREIAIRNIEKEWHTLWILQQFPEIAHAADMEDIENWDRWEDIDIDDPPFTAQSAKVSYNKPKTWDDHYNEDDYLDDFRYSD
jgi:hypothetical protein